MIRTRRQHLGRAVAIELLEIRRLFDAPFVVNTTDDETASNTTTSLREAMILAGNNAGDDTITFDSTVFASGALHTITLTQGELTYIDGTAKLTISGPGSDVLAVAGSGSDRVFNFDTGTNIKLTGMTVRDGFSTSGGGGIGNAGTLALSDVTVRDNTVQGDLGSTGDNVTPGGKGGTARGGGIYNSGALSLDGCLIHNNTAQGGIGGTALAGNGAGGDGLGGNLYTTGSVTMTQTNFSDGHAQGGSGATLAGVAGGKGGAAMGGGLYVGSHNAVISITNGNFNGDDCTGGNGGNGDATHGGADGGNAGGGSIYSDSDSFSASTTQVGDGRASGGFGGTGSVGGNGGAANGGAIYNNSVMSFVGLLSIHSSHAFGGGAGLGDGGAATGGAVYNQGDLHLTKVNVFNSVAQGGSTVSGNGGSALGGGLASNAGTVQCGLAKFTTDQATGGNSNAGFAGGGEGGGVFTGLTVVTLDRTTVATNAATGGNAGTTAGGLGGGLAVAGGLFLGTTGSVTGHTITNSTISGNTAQGGKGGNATAGAGGQGGGGDAGGIYTGSPLTLANSTIYGNNAIGGKGGDGTTVGGTGGGASEGAISLDDTTLSATNVTIAFNGAHGNDGGAGPTAGAAGASFYGAFSSSVIDTVSLANVVVSDNMADNFADIQGSIVAINSLISNTTGLTLLTGSANNILNQSAQLNSLTDNGGPTLTALPMDTSPVIDKGDNASATAAGLTFDQRGDGFPRVINGTVDIGAVETPLSPSPVFTLIGNGHEIAEDDTTPSSLDFTDFGTAKVGTPIDRTFTIRNDGNSALNLGFISLPVGFSVLAPFTSPVAPGDETNFTIRFDPGLPGAFGGDVQISDNVGNTLNHFDFTIAGNTNEADGKSFRVNFQPAAAEVPSGYLLDAGQVFGSRGNGYSYGFDASAQSFTRDRNAVNDQAKDTLVHTQLFGNRTWEATVPNGTYTVHLVAGDPSFIDSIYKINVEGVLTVNGTPTSGNHFIEGTKTVTVTDGKLTITNASGAKNNKLDFIEVTPAAAPPPTTIKINFQTASSPTPAGFLADSGAVFGSRGNGQSYGWNSSATTFTRDRNVLSDQSKDTLIHTQLYGPRIWELAVPNGMYKVHLVAGDPSFFDSVYKFNAEGTLVLSGTPTSGNRFVDATKTVTVSDGRLTIANAAGSVNNKIDFIEVTPA